MNKSWYKIASDEYWGKKASGCLFVCREDQTILLFKRSKYVEEVGTWGITGGAIDKEERGFEDDFFDPHLEEIENPEDEIFNNSAIKETMEEAGGFPEQHDLIGTVDFTEGSFTYRTYIYDLSLEEKNNWTSLINLNWESDKADWFSINALPPSMHPGIKNKFQEIKALVLDFNPHS